MNPQPSQNPDNTPELEALLQLTTDSNETLNGIEATNEAAAIALEDIASNQETQLVQDEENTKKVVEPLERIAENTKNVVEVLEKNSEPISKLAAFLSDMKGDTGETGKKGDKGDKGETGDKGDAGTKGDTGERGELGEKGDTGDSIKGDSGKDGINGKDGVDGRDGKDGLSPDVTGFTQEMEEKVTKITDTKYEEVASILSKKIGSKTYAMSELSDTQTATVGQTMVKSAGETWVPGSVGSGSAHTIEDEGTPLAQQATLNFVGAGVTVTDVGAKTTVTIPGGSGSGITRSVSNIAINTTAGATAVTDYEYNCTAALTLTLPTAVGNTNRYTVTRITGLTTVATTAAQTINGSATATLTINNMSLDFVSDGANWNVK